MSHLNIKVQSSGGNGVWGTCTLNLTHLEKLYGVQCGLVWQVSKLMYTGSEPATPLYMCLCPVVRVLIPHCMCARAPLYVCSCPVVRVLVPRCMCACAPLYVCLCPVVRVLVPRCMCAYASCMCACASCMCARTPLCVCSYPIVRVLVPHCTCACGLRLSDQC